MVFNGKMYITNCKYARAFVLFIPAAQSIFHSIFFSFDKPFQMLLFKECILKSNLNCRWCWWRQRRHYWLRGLRWWRWRYPRHRRWGPSRLWRWERRIVNIDDSKLLLSRHFYDGHPYNIIICVIKNISFLNQFHLFFKIFFVIFLSFETFSVSFRILRKLFEIFVFFFQILDFEMIKPTQASSCTANFFAKFRCFCMPI